MNTAAGISRKVSEKLQNTNLNQLIAKPFIHNTPKQIPIETKTSTYVVSIQNKSEKKRYNYITQTYIKNIYKIRTYLNLNPRSNQTKDPSQDYITQK